MDLQLKADELSGVGRVICGDFAVTLILQDAGALIEEMRSAVACALSAQDAGQAFELFVTTSGIDSSSEEAFVRTPSGSSLLLEQGRVASGGCDGGSSIGQVYELDEAPCSMFSPGENTSYFWVYDAGFPTLSCDAGAWAILCPGHCL